MTNLHISTGVPPRRLHRQPVNLDGCFGWLHVPLAGMAADTAVVLCPGVHSDALTGYRTLRSLADALAEAGFPTLRLQYPGTGNSDNSAATEYWDAWQHSIHVAADWLRDQSGARHLALCGFRFGAILAAVVAENRSDVSALLLLAPVLRGRTYIRQLIIEAGLPSVSGAAGRGFVLDELTFLPETVQLIGKVDLRRIMLPAGCRVAVYSPSQSPILAECLDLWRRSGIVLSCNDFAGLEPMLRPTFMNHQAAAMVHPLVAWLRMAMPASLPSHRQMGMPKTAEITTVDWIEVRMHFGTDGALFGILCRPSSVNEADLAVIIGNSGGNPHCAPVAVDLGRRLAAAGIASLRIDFAGLGDSLAPGDQETHVFETSRLADFSAAIDALSIHGYRHFAVQGLCSAAYHAFQAGLADPRIALLLLVNLPLFQWPTGYPVELLGVETVSSVRMIQKLGQKDLWMALLWGDKTFSQRLGWWKNWLVARCRLFRRGLSRVLGFKPPMDFAWESMKEVSQRARIQLLFAEHDPGIAVIAQAFGSNRAPFGVTVDIVPGLDHSLTRSYMRRIVAEHMIGFLRRNVPALPEPSLHVETSDFVMTTVAKY